MGPYQVIPRTTGGSYVLAEMDGSILRHYVAAYRLIPYLDRSNLDHWADQTEIETESRNDIASDHNTND
jgi:hypothetical protein